MLDTIIVLQVSVWRHNRLTQDSSRSRPGIVSTTSTSEIANSISFLKKRAEENKANLTDRVDQSHPILHIRKHQHNFKLNPATIRASRIKPASILSFHGTQVGRWTLTLRDGKKMNFQFENSEDMEVAVSSLPKVIGQTLTVDVERNEKTNKFTKRRK